MLLVESTKNMIPLQRGATNEAETWNLKIKKSELLHRQAALTSKWVRDFKISQTEPGQEDFSKPARHFFNESSEIPKQLQKFDEFYQQHLQ